MSKLSRFLKRQEKNVRGMYDKNLGSFVERWKRPAIGAALGVGAGYLGGAGGLTAAQSIGLGVGVGSAGIGAGYQRTKRRQGEWAAAADLEKQQQARGRAGNQLDEILDPYLPNPEDEKPPGTDYTPPGTDPTEPPIAIEPPIDPETGNPILPPEDELPPEEEPVDIYDPKDDVTAPNIDERMGDIDVGGAGGIDSGRILDETERARQLQMDTWNQQNAMREENRRKMAETLNSQMDRQFNENVPGYLEDLNTRGLLRSSALGDRLSKERSRMGANVNEQLAMQAIQDSQGSIGGLGGIQDQYLQGRQGAMGRRFSLEDFARQTEAAKLLGQATAPITPYTGGGKGGSAQAGMAAGSLGLGIASGKGGTGSSANTPFTGAG